MDYSKQRQKSVHRKKLYENLNEMPFYIEEFVEYKELHDASPSTLLNYVYDFRVFFNWLLSEQIIEFKPIKDISFSDLENLKKKDVENFMRFLKLQQNMQNSSVNRKISALKSLFKYLTSLSENEDGECYFYRNVMAKIEIHKDKETLNARAKRMRSKIFHNDDDQEFLNYVKYEHEKSLTKHQLFYFLRDKERDVAILSLFLGSGIRVSELADLRMEDINLKERLIDVIRKGNKEDSVWITPIALNDLENYMEIRANKYAPGKELQNVFLSKYKHTAQPLSVRAIQDIVEKYTKAYGKKMSPHKLRHTLANKLYMEEKDSLQVMQQLGHTSQDTALLYTQLGETTIKDSLGRIGKNKE
ncbi:MULTISPECIES: tyrosine recombinase XerS [Bacillus]|uniref:Tyrosine recombinase XerS n=1 Tax=Bacillus anthracis TaxID=1392 RepID=A0A2A7D298_BACAN|nr:MULTISPECIES: tyrosine recombinase XerS [Bacillus]MCP1166685.1 tyrosine recombinase XerS [Bacillus sp. 1813sda1]MDC7973060.1 tyrosine recombinase XerS [Bacillus sp. BLCC-B18]PDZ14126.1 tyrosine recombinase XerS [Bacillus anthracis]PDZ48341.1 tyrosine recombinase XerS [Bacillus sp. AFS094611]